MKLFSMCVLMQALFLNFNQSAQAKEYFRGRHEGLNAGMLKREIPKDLSLTPKLNQTKVDSKIVNR